MPDGTLWLDEHRLSTTQCSLEEFEVGSEQDGIAESVGADMIASVS